MISGSSRASYLAPAYSWLSAAGGVLIERTFGTASIPAAARTALRGATIAVLLVAGALRAPFTLPILPVDTYVAYADAMGVRPGTDEKKDLGRLGQFYADMHGWESIVATIAGVYDVLPPEERAKAAIFASDYGVAGAVSARGA